MRYPLLLSVLLLAACGPKSAEPTAPTEVQMSIAHTALSDAVASTGDAELASWVSAPEQYVIRPVPDDRLTQFDHFRVINIESSHPMSFELVRDRSTGALLVTSGRPGAIKSLLQKEANLVASDEVYELVKDLYAVAPAATEVIRSAKDLPDGTDGTLRAQLTAPSLEQGVDGLTLTMNVVDDLSRLQLWVFTMPWAGESAFTQSQLGDVPTRD